MRLTELGRYRVGLLAVLAILAGVAALLLAPDVDTRQDADDLSTLFSGGLGLMAIILAAYVTFAVTGGSKSEYFNRRAVIFALIGLVATVCGLLTLPLATYQFAFAALIMGAVHGVITIAVMLIGLAR